MSDSDEIAAAKDTIVEQARRDTRPNRFMRPLLAKLDALESRLPHEYEFSKWWNTCSAEIDRLEDDSAGGRRFMVLVLRWRLRNPELDLNTCIRELEREQAKQEARAK